jgi:hypothetical protein
MKKITLMRYALLFTTLFCCSGRKDGIKKLSQDDLSINTPGYNVYEHSSLVSYLADTTISYYHYKVVPGTNTVFEYYYKEVDSELIADDEFEQKIVFEIDGQLRKFSYYDGSILDTKCLSTWRCMCPPPKDEDFTINKGSIIGRKLNDSLWNVSIDIVPHSPVLKYTKIQAEFKVVNRNQEK